MRVIGMLCIGLALGAAVTGCAGRKHARTVAGGSAEPDERAALMERVVVVPPLDRSLAVIDARARWEGMIRRVEVTVENRTAAPLGVEYRWEWTDADGFEVGETQASWQPAVVDARGEKTIGESGPGPSATTFNLRLRKAGKR